MKKRIKIGKWIIYDQNNIELNIANLIFVTIVLNLLIVLLLCLNLITNA